MSEQKLRCNRYKDLKDTEMWRVTDLDGMEAEFDSKKDAQDEMDNHWKRKSGEDVARISEKRMYKNSVVSENRELKMSTSDFPFLNTVKELTEKSNIRAVQLLKNFKDHYQEFLTNNPNANDDLRTRSIVFESFTMQRIANLQIITEHSAEIRRLSEYFGSKK